MAELGAEVRCAGFCSFIILSDEKLEYDRSARRASIELAELDGEVRCAFGVLEVAHSRQNQVRRSRMTVGSPPDYVIIKSACGLFKHASSNLPTHTGHAALMHVDSVA